MGMKNRISDDINDLRIYFHKIFEVVGTSTEFSDLGHFTSYVKLDMLCNLYSCLDFWLKHICKQKQLNLKLNLKFKDIKADNEFAVYHKYLVKVAGVNMDDVNKEYNNLQKLRVIRNSFIHAGSHAVDIKKISDIPGVTLHETLICVSKEYVINSIEEAEKYLLSASNA
jgi:hypothetical protein